MYAFVAEVVAYLLMVVCRKRPELLFGCLAGTLMLTYKYNVRGAKTILGYNPKEARKEREARKQREKMAKKNIDISLC